MSIFSQKLDLLPATVLAAGDSDVSALAKNLRDNKRRAAIAVGSGGSAVAAEFLALCRSTLGRGPTSVQTPLAFTLDLSHLHETDVWLFSAGGDNFDILAALTTAKSRAAKSVTIVTSNPDAQLIASSGGMRNLTVQVTPRAEPKDGFLATHSLLGAVVALLKASAAVADDHILPELIREVRDAAQHRLSREGRQEIVELLTGAANAEAVLLLHDPRLAAPAVLLDTSLWESAICAVQRADFRNFAHGRHVWLAKRPEGAFLLALTGAETHPIWTQIDGVLPTEIPRLTRNYGRCSRFDTYLAVLDAFAIVEALSAARDIDPGKPDVGEFARPIYDSDSLSTLAGALSAPVRQKRFICALYDEIGAPVGDLPAAYEKLLHRLSTASFGGLVLDYDGTVVATDKRFEPPTDDMVKRLTKLLDAGLRLGIATGRGGSAGEDLRAALPERHHATIKMGYYNGAHIAPLGQDIRDARPEPHPAIQSALGWARSRQDLFDGEFKDSGVQATIDIKRIRSPEAFLVAYSEAPFAGHSNLKLVQSRHSFDLCPMEACKTNVVNAIQAEIGDTRQVLCVGDSGGSSGNDHVMLGLPFGISVDHVCSREDVGWSLFGAECTGPDALLRILSAMTPNGTGGFAINAALLVDG